MLFARHFQLQSSVLFYFLAKFESVWLLAPILSFAIGSIPLADVDLMAWWIFAESWNLLVLYALLVQLPCYKHEQHYCS